MLLLLLLLLQLLLLLLLFRVVQAVPVRLQESVPYVRVLRGVPREKGSP